MVNNLREKQELIRLIQLCDQQEAVLDQGKLDRYEPHANGPDGGQLAFHKSNAKIRAVVCGNRWGKTVSSIVECAWLANGLHPYHPIPVPNRGKLYADSYPAVMENIFIKLQEWIPPKLLKPGKPFTYSNQGMLTGINWACGSITRIGSYDQLERKAEGSNWHYVGFDEPPSRDLYIANLRGLVDFGGLMWFSMTPLSEAWIYDDIWLPGLNGEKPHIHCFRGTGEDNPYKDPEGYKIFISELTPDEYSIRHDGEFKRLSGLVMSTYDPDLSDIDPFDLDENYVIYEGIDPHPQKPHCALWKALDRDNFRYVVDEFSCPGGIDEFGRGIAERRRLLTKHGAILVKSVNDTSLNATDPRTRLNLRQDLCQVLQQEGESIMPYNADKKDNLLQTYAKVKDLFRPVLQRSAVYGEIVSDKLLPMQYVFKHCRRYKYELLHHQWPDTIHDNTKPVPKHDDFIACDRYIETLAPHYHTPGQRLLKKNTADAYSKIRKHGTNIQGSFTSRPRLSHSRYGSGY